jgi:hypothetical protein
MTKAKQLDKKREKSAQPETQSAQVVAAPAEQEQEEVMLPQAAEQPAKGAVKKRKKVVPKEEDLMPRSSIWPLVTTVAISLILVGFVFQPIVCGLGVVLLIGCIIGWIYERR